MKLILHHLRKDIRAQRWLLLILFTLLLLQIAIDWIETLPDYHLASTVEFIRTTSVLTLCSELLWIMLLARLIQSEPVTGDASFWLTRPIPRGAYIPSKLLFILLFLVLPWLIPVPLDMHHLGVEPTRIWGNLKNSLSLDLYFTLVVLWIATYTRTTSHFWILFIAVSLAIVAVIAGSAYLRFLFRGNFPNYIEFLVTRVGLSMLIFFGGLLVSLTIQHTRRRAKSGFGVGISFAVIAALVALFWPFSISSKFLLDLVLFTAPESAKTTTATFTDNWREHVSWKHDVKKDNGEWVAFAPLTPSVIDKPRIPVISNISANFESRELSNNATGLLNTFDQFDCTKTIVDDFPDIRVTGSAFPTPGQNSLALFNIADADLNQFKGKTGMLKLTLWGRLNSLTREAVIPLQSNAVAPGSRGIIHVARLARAPGGLFTPFNTENYPVLAVWNLGYPGLQTNLPPPHYYVLVDTKNKTGTFLFTSQSDAINGTNLFYNKVSDHVYLRLKGDEPLNQMVLYIYELKPGDYFNANLTDPNFVMNPRVVY